jgi:hypothetical protein
MAEGSDEEFEFPTVAAVDQCPGPLVLRDLASHVVLDAVEQPPRRGRVPGERSVACVGDGGVEAVEVVTGRG